MRQATEQESVEPSVCPFCHRPLHERDNAPEAHDYGVEYSPDRPFVDPEYFAMLAESQRPSPAGSGQATPSRRVHLALRSGRSREVSSSLSEPPADAEFISSEPSARRSQGISSSAFSPGYFNQFFREIRELGRGGNGVVLLVEHLIDDVSLGEFACKRIPVGDSKAYFEKVIVEVRLLQKIPHRNLVAYHWTWLEDHQPSKFGPSIPCLWILQDYCNGGDLQNYVLGSVKEPSATESLKARLRRMSKGDTRPDPASTRTSRLSLDEIFSFFKDIATGLHHLHSKGYIHRDLKPSNCLLQHDGGRTTVLISDFGEVQLAGDSRRSTGATGTVAYLAPEVLQQSPDGLYQNFTTKSDIFSLGMIVYFMCFGRLPYASADGINEEDEDLDKLRAEITTWPGFNDESRLRSDLPERLYKYLKRLLSVDPEERPGTGDILASIKGGVNLGEPSWSMEDFPSRVSSADGVGHSSRTRTHSTRADMRSLSRHDSSGDVRHRSPAKRDATLPRPSSARANSMALDLRKDDGTTSRIASPHHSPRLMLPPPPEPSGFIRLFRLVDQPRVIFAVRATFFLAKLASFMLLCAPHAVQPWLFYPLLVLAAMDLGSLAFNLRQSLLLLSIHSVAVIVASQHDVMCQGTPVIVWETEPKP